jgi:signal transduction histidine kinase
MSTISLHGLVSGLVQSFLPLTTRNHTIVLNEIPRDISVAVDENMLAFVLWNLLDGAIQNAHDKCIHVEALTIGDRLTVRIKDVGAYFYHAISGEYRRVQEVARMLGGTISINDSSEWGTHAAFSISSNLVAA